MGKFDDKPTKPGWIGVDLDGTLAYYAGWDPDNLGIGEPIPAMLERVKFWVANGHTVKIMTARVAHEHGSAFVRQEIEEWCLKHIGRKLEVTCQKDYAMIELWDDRAVRVKANEGVPCCEHHESKPSYHKIT